MFWFANRRVRESAKTSSKTLAKAAEQTRRRVLETGFNNGISPGMSRKQILRHYSHIRLEAKRTALESIIPKQTATGEKEQNNSPLPKSAQQVETGFPQKPHSA